MTEISISLPYATLLAMTAGVLGWTVRVLWQLDRRVLRIETRLKITSEEHIP